MAMEKNNKHGGGIHFLAGYGWQVLAVPLGAAVLLLIFGYDAELFWMNVLVLALWVLLVLVMFQRRPDEDFWRNYRWIVAPAVLILLFFLDISWAQSALSISSLKKRAIWPPASETFPVHAEYPLQILFDDAEPSEIGLWLADAAGCGELEISAEGLRFAVKPPSDAPPVWSETLTLKLSPTIKAVTVLAQPFPPPEMTSETVRVILAYNGTTLDKPFEIAVESKREAKIRGWKKDFLATGSTVVSLIVAVFAGIKQLDEEKKRQKAERIKQAITSFETDARNNLSKTLQEHLELTEDWNEWDKKLQLQDQFRDVHLKFIKEKLFEVLLSLTIDFMQSRVDQYLELCGRMFDNQQEEESVSILKQLRVTLRQDADSPRALLSLLKKHPPSVEVARRIAASFSPELKKQTIAVHAAEFPDQIRALRVELGFGDPESFPLRRQFAFHARPAVADDRLNAWLKSRGLECSPFADDGSPFYSVLGDQLLVELASPGFLFPTFDRYNVTFEFANDWDAAAALYAYCRSLQSAMTIKEEIFFVPLSPALMMTHEGVDVRKLYLHALAEQWLWSLAETPTLFYALKDERLDLAGRLLRWHDFSPSLTAHKIAQFAGYLQAQEKKHQADLLSRITAWLKDKDATDLQAEEVNGLIELRPPSKQQTIFLLSASDLNPHVRPRISQNVYEELARQSDWLSAHNCGFICFLVGDKNRQSVSQASLIEQCRIRVQKCSNSKLEFNELFDAPGQEPDVLLAQKAGGSPGKMVRLGQKLLLQHAAKPSPEEYLQIEDLLAL